MKPEWLTKLEEAHRLLREAEEILFTSPEQDMTWESFHDAHNLTFDIQTDVQSVWTLVVKKINPTEE